MDKEIIIDYQPNIDSLVKVSKYLIINLPFLKYIPLLLLIVTGFTLLPEFLDSSLYNNKTRSILDYLPLIFAPLIWIFIYYKTIAITKKNILGNTKNFESQKISFNHNSYIQEGQSFKVENFWNETYQIKETKEWLLIYPKKNLAFPIIKSKLKDNQYNELKSFFNSLNIKKSLK